MKIHGKLLSILVLSSMLASAPSFADGGRPPGGDGNPTPTKPDPAPKPDPKPDPAPPQPQPPGHGGGPDHGPGPGPAPQGGGYQGGGDNDTGVAVAAGIDVVGGIVQAIINHKNNTKAVSWEWLVGSDDQVHCYPFNMYGTQIPKKIAADSACGDQPKPTNFAMSEDANGNPGCYAYDSNGDMVNNDQPVDQSLCDQAATN